MRARSFSNWLTLPLASLFALSLRVANTVGGSMSVGVRFTVAVSEAAFQREHTIDADQSWNVGANTYLSATFMCLRKAHWRYIKPFPSQQAADPLLTGLLSFCCFCQTGWATLGIMACINF